MAEAITIARPYATAAFRLAKQSGTLKQWSEQLDFLAKLASDPSMQVLIQDPKLSAAKLEEMVLLVSEGKLDEQLVNLVKLINEYGRLALMPVIYEAYETLRAEDEGTLEAELSAPYPLTQQQIAQLTEQLEKRLGKKIEVQTKLDSELIGGIKIVVGDTVIDSSVKGQLQALAYTLKA